MSGKILSTQIINRKINGEEDKEGADEG